MMIPATFRDRPYAAERFRAIVEHARETNPFYREWISDPENVPILPRSVFVENNDRILDGREPNQTTSGSTGRPVRFVVGQGRGRMNFDDDRRFEQWLGGRRQTARIVNIKPGGPKPNEFSLLRPASEQVEFIRAQRRDRGVTAVTTFPGNVEPLCREIIDRGLDFSFIARFGMLSESVDPWHRELARRAFPNALVWTTYSAREFGMIAAQCPFEPTCQHIMAHKLGVEILRDDGTPCANGERGEVVITDYFNRLTPFVRFAIGDLAVPEPCPCGRITLPALGDVFGKVLGTILLRTGERGVFSYAQLGIQERRDIRQYQVIQEAVERFTVRLAADPDRERDEWIAGRFEAYLGYPVEVVFEFVDSIPKLPNGKYLYVVSKV